MKRYVFYILLPVLFYPVYFTVANMLDTVLGEQQLVNGFYFDSRLILLETFVTDWLQSLPVMYAIMFLVILPAESLVNRVTSSQILLYMVVMLIIGALSYGVGFREVGLAINVMSILGMTVFYRLSKIFILKA